MTSAFAKTLLDGRESGNYTLPASVTDAAAVGQVSERLPQSKRPNGSSLGSPTA